MASTVREIPVLPRPAEPPTAPVAPAPGGWTRLAAYAARLLDAPLGVVSLTDGTRPHAWTERAAGPWGARAAAPLPRTLCRHTVARGRALLIGDARVHPVVRDDPGSWMGELAYAGVPLRDGGGAVRGCLAVADGRVRAWTEADARALDDLADLGALLLDRADGRTILLPALPRRRRLSLRMLEKAVETMQLGVTITDPSGRILYSNPADARMHGYAQDELRGKHARIFAPAEHARELSPQALDGVASWSRETVNVRSDGSVFPVLLRSDIVRDGEGRALGLVTCCEDLTRRREMERQLVQNAFFDAVTGVANRGLLSARLELELHRARRGEAAFALLAVGLRRFKVVNDSLGVDAGDAVLRAAAERLQQVTGADALVARLTGAEFAVLLEGVSGVEAAARVAGRITGVMARPFAVGDQEVTLGAAVGIALSSTGYERVDDVLRDAGAAMYRAKAQRSGGYALFDADMHARAMERLRLETDLRRALRRRELEVHYQPIVRLADGVMTGVEALVRWRHPQRGMVMPDQFVALAEETGLIVPMGLWVMDRACRDLAVWNARRPASREPLTLSVNLSPKQLAEPALPERVGRLLRATGTPPGLLRLEITENVLVHHADGQDEALHALKDAGVHLFIDDFGTGYSSLGYLHRLPLDGLKVDRAFVSGAARSDGLHLVRAIVAMARALEVQVVTEGVEQAEQADELRALGCAYAQGYHFAPPMEADRLAALAETDPRW